MPSATLPSLPLTAVLLWLAGCTLSTDDTLPLPVETQGDPVPISYPSDPPFYDRPDWVEEAVIYELSVRDFTAEGTFRAVIPHLPALKKMGVTTLWLMPIHPIGEARRQGERGSPYSVRDFYDVNPHFGSKEDFRALVEAVHELDMRILLDLVANHTAWDHPWIEEHPAWYERDATGAITHPEGTDWWDVAALDYDHPEVHKAMKEVMRYWVETFDVDGYRCDAADRVPADFWGAAIEELRSVKPVLMLAEAETPALHERGFDLSYSRRLYHTLKAVWNGSPTSLLASALEEERQTFPDHALRLRFTTNHDEAASDGPPATLFDGLRGARAAALFTKTTLGIPLLYNGQEIGSTRHPFEEAPIDWDQHPEMRAFYTRLLHLVRRNPALREGDLILHHPEGNDVLVLERAMEHERLLVLINVRDRRALVPVPETWQDRMLHEVFEDETYRVRAAVALPGYGFRVFTKDRGF